MTDQGHDQQALLDEIEEAKEEWEEECLQPILDKYGVRKEEFRLSDGEPVDLIYGPEDTAEVDYVEDLGYPGQYPFTRGIQPTMYRGKLWTMR